MENQIIVLGFEGQLSAEATLKHITRMQEENLIEVQDAVIASRGSGTHVEIKQTHPQEGKFALRGGGVGVLAGLLLGGPIVGLAGGAAIGAIAGRLKDYGIDDAFVKAMSDGLTPKSSALFLMVRAKDAEKALEALKPLKANVLSTTLAQEQEQRLRDVLAKEEYD